MQRASKTIQRLVLCLVILFLRVDVCSADSLIVYFHKSYDLNRSAQETIGRSLENYLTEELGRSYKVNVNWLNYEGAMDFYREKKPSVALLTTGMYCKIRSQIDEDENSPDDISALGVVKRYGTTTYKYLILVKKGMSLKNSSSFKGAMAINKKESLSGSLFPLYYLITNYNFPKSLIDDDKVREEWASVERYQVRLDTFKAKNSTLLLYCGEGIDADRDRIQSNGWDVYPLRHEDDYKFEITRSLLLERNLPQDVNEKIKALFLNGSNPVGRHILNLIGVNGFSSINPGKIEKVVEKYKAITRPSGSAYERLIKKISDQAGLYTLAFLLLIAAHLYFRYSYGNQKENVRWFSLIIVLKFSIFICEIWFFEPEAVIFIPVAIATGALDNKAFLKLVDKAKSLINPVQA